MTKKHLDDFLQWNKESFSPSEKIEQEKKIDKVFANCHKIFLTS